MTESKPLGMDTDLTAAGDTLQSAASRMGTWIRSLDPQIVVPYEVSMAAIEGLDAAEDWTAARCATPATEDGESSDA